MRWLIVLLLWLQAIALTSATRWFEVRLRQYLGLRFEVLIDPILAAQNHCTQRSKELPAPRWPLSSDCRLDLHWWRDRGVEHEVCADLAAGQVGLNLAAPRRYHLLMHCTLGFPGHWLQLPLLQTTFFR